MRHSGPIFLILAALFWGVSGGIGGMLLERGWDPYLIALVRGATGLLFMAGWLVVHPRRRTEFRCGSLWFWSALAGLGVAGNFTLYFISVEHASVSIAAPLMYCAPVFVFVASFLLGLERPTLLKGIGIALVLIGVGLLTGIHDLEAAEIGPMAIAAGLGAGAAYALFIFAFKFAAARGSAPAVLAIAFLVLVAVLLVPAGPDQAAAALTSSAWPLFLALGILGAGVSFVLYVVGLRSAAPAIASVVAMVEPVAAAVFGVTVLGDRLTAMQYAGMGLVLIPVTLLAVSSGGYHRGHGAGKRGRRAREPG